MIENFIQVGDQGQMRLLMDRSVGIVVDRNNVVTIGHTLQVMASTADAARDVEVRSHRLAGLSNLPFVLDPAGIDHRTARRNARSQLLRNVPKSIEPLTAPQTAATRN